MKKSHLIFVSLILLFRVQISFCQDAATFYEKMKESVSSPEEFEKNATLGLERAVSEQNAELQSIFLFELAKWNSKNGFSSDAIEYAKKSLKFFEKLNDVNKELIVLKLLFDLQKKTEVYSDALLTAKSIISKDIKSNCKYAMEVAQIYLRQNNFKAAIANLTPLSCNDLENIKKHELLGVAYNNYGNHDEALKQFKLGLIIASKYGSPEDKKKFESLVLSSLSNTQQKNKVISSFEVDDKKEKAKYMFNLERTSKTLFDRISKLSKDLQIEELKYLYLEQAYQTNKFKSRLTLQEKNFEIQKKEKESSLQKAEISITRANLQARNYWILFLLAFSFFGAILTIFILKSAKKQKLLNRVLFEQNTEIREQKDVIQLQNNKLDQSIEYGRFIQSQFLPSFEGMQRLFTDSFMIYKPLDKVSGDFLWYKEKKGIKYACLVDCTGHGIPGALLSIIANEAFEKASDKDFRNLVELLNFVSYDLHASFQKNSLTDHVDIEEGMDLCILAIDEKDNSLKIASANNSAVLLLNEKEEIVKTSRDSINANVPFIKTQEVEFTYQKGDLVFLFTDGAYDQIGGDQKKKIGKKAFIQQLIEMKKVNFDNQKNLLNSQLIQWQGFEKQMDDVSILGIKL